MVISDQFISFLFISFSIVYLFYSYFLFQSNMDKMIDCAKEVCPYITSADVST